MFVVELMDANSQAIEATLDDVLYYIIVNWNESAQSWQMGIRDSAYNLLIDGIRMVPNFPLLTQFKYAEVPDGELIIHDYTLTKSQRIPRDGFLLERYELVYYTVDDIVELFSINAV